MNSRVNIGELDTLVIFKSCEITRGAQGEKVKSYTVYGEAFAKVERQVSETIEEDNLEAGHSLTLTAYKVQGLTTRWQVEVEGKPYEIVSIDNLERMSPFFVLQVRAIDG